jgi:5-methylcytosine-specific restriction endonuclease McrA
MKKHTKIYMKYFDYIADDFIPCEVCDSKAVDIHHIEARGMGGSDKDNINNLMAVCRKCHIKYGDKKKHLEWLQEIHKNKIEEQATGI